MSTAKATGKCFLKTGFERMMEVSNKTLKRPFLLSTEAVVASRYLVWPKHPPSRQKQDRRGPRLPAGRKGHNMNETSSSGSLAVPAPS
jgi:hypothetical protein